MLKNKKLNSYIIYNYSFCHLTRAIIPARKISSLRYFIIRKIRNKDLKGILKFCEKFRTDKGLILTKNGLLSSQGLKVRFPRCPTL